MRLGEITSGLSVAAEYLGYREWHIVLVADGRRYRLSIGRCVANERLAFLTPAGRDADFRAAMIMALHRELLRLGGGRAAPRGSPGPTERWRLVQWLRLLDALAEGAASREIAATLILADTASLSAAEWDASSERRRLARWQHAALAMRDGGYRRLLAAA